LKYLLDSHVLFWIITGDLQLSRKAKNIYLDEKNKIFISIASLWEIAIKISLNKLSISMRLPEFVQEHVIANEISIMPIELTHIYNLENLPFYHRDPFDRLIIAQSMAEKINILSNDTVFDRYPVKRIW